MHTPERTRFALEQMVNNQQVDQGTTVDPSLIVNVSSAGVAQEDTRQAPVFNAEFQHRFLDLVNNEFYSRTSLLQKWMDPRRDYNRECGYPETTEITADKWQEYYERHSIAARVVELMPSECWQVTPELTEVEDPNVETPFELAFKELAKTLRNTESFYKPEEQVVHPLWEYCKRADIMSGIGRFGLILLGFNDGLSLNQPVKGWQEPQSANMTWNEEALPFIRESIGKYVTLNSRGELVWNAKKGKKDLDDPSQYDSKKKKKKSTDKENMQSARGTLPDEPTPEEDLQEEEPVLKKGLPPEPTDVDPNAPSPMAFGNVNPQQSKYRDPLDTQAQKDIRPQDPQQPEFGMLTTKENEPLEQGRQQEQLQLMYLRVFPEALVQIVRYEQNMGSPRYGQPVLYRITLNDPSQQYTGVGLPLSTVEVHYSRVIHLADVGANAVSSEIFAASRMRPVLNHLIDLQKIYGACGEGYWKNAFATLVAETHPQLGGDVTIDSANLRTQMKQWRDSLDRVLAATGITWKTIVPGQVDPNSYVQNEMQAICIKLECPMRVFMGNEIGQLASGQDAVAWNFRVKARRKNYITIRIVVPLIDRLILVGVLPRPESYNVEWPEDQALLPNEKASIAGALTGAMATYISGQCDQFMEPITYLTEIWGWSRKKSQAAIDATVAHIQKQQEAQAMQGQQAIDPMTGQPLEQDEMGQFIDPNTGEPLQVDEMGKPVMIDPQTGQPMPVQMQSAAEQQGPLGAEAAEQMQQGAEGEQELPEQGFREEGQAAQMGQEVGGQAVGSAAEEEQEGQVDEDTGLPIDPNTGYLIDQESGYLIDKESGDVYDPETGEPVGINVFDQADEEGEQDGTEQNLEGQEDPQEVQPDLEEERLAQPIEGEDVDSTQGEVDPETGWPVDPNTGYLVNPDTNFQLDPQTGDVYDPKGKRVGNVNDAEL